SSPRKFHLRGSKSDVVGWHVPRSGKQLRRIPVRSVRCEHNRGAPTWTTLCHQAAFRAPIGRGAQVISACGAQAQSSGGSLLAIAVEPENWREEKQEREHPVGDTDVNVMEIIAVPGLGPAAEMPAQRAPARHATIRVIPGPRLNLVVSPLTIRQSR